MAKKIKTIEQVREDIEDIVMDRLVEIDDVIAEEYEIECYDSCLDSMVWNDTLKTIVDMYVGAIVFDRDWDGKAGKYKQEIDISSMLEKKALKRQIKELNKQLEKMV